MIPLGTGSPCELPDQESEALRPESSWLIEERGLVDAPWAEQIETSRHEIVCDQGVGDRPSQLGILREPLTST